MGDISNGTTFVKAGYKNKSNLWTALLSIVLTAVILFALYITLFSWATGSNFIISAVLGVIIAVALVLFVMNSLLIITGRELQRLGFSYRIQKFNLDNYIKSAKLMVTLAITILFNWMDKKILVIQLISYLVFIYSFYTIVSDPFSMFSNPFIINLSSLAGSVAGLLIFYNGIRLSLTLQTFQTSTGGSRDSVRKSWELSKKEFWEILQLGQFSTLPSYLYVGIFFVVAFLIVTGLTLLISFSGNLTLIPVTTFLYAILFVLFAAVSLSITGSGGAFVYSIVSKAKISMVN